MAYSQTRPQPGTTATARPAAAARASAAQPDRDNAPMAGLRSAPAAARDHPASRAPAQMSSSPGAEESQLPYLPLYERLIGGGIAAADARGSAIDHVTARRLAICLARPAAIAGLRPEPGQLRSYRVTAPTCPKAPTADATARLSPPARPGSPPGCAPSSPPTRRSPGTTPRSHRTNPTRHSIPAVMRPTGRLSSDSAQEQAPGSAPERLGQPSGSVECQGGA
jgi:hypothetical protein